MINKFNIVHNNKYDYTLVNLENLKIDIICPIHGIFSQNKYSHKSGMGCWKCSVDVRSKNQSMGKDKFIEKSNKIHNNKYDYSKIEYINNNKKVEIICNIHGCFNQTPGSHLNGNGCPKCGTESSAKNQRDTTEIFIEKSKKVHGDKYDYSYVNYIDRHTKVKIICKEHGFFEQLPNNHISGQICGKCAGKNITKEEFIEKCKKIHDNKYDYSLVKYTNTQNYINIICQKHGIFSQKATNHLNQENGCPKCYGVNIKSNTVEFVEKSKKLYLDRYDYSLTDYKQANSPVIIICKKHGQFNQDPSHHLSGQGCPVCKSSKGENEIFRILKQKNINFHHHHKLLDFNLEFDFYLPDHKIGIEYDGIQHFKPIKYFGGDNAFKDQQRRDREKDEYCIKNNIILLRIPYYKFAKIKTLIDKINFLNT